MKKTILPAVLMAVIISASCTSTKITSSWREPDKAVAVSTLNKVLVVALFKDETSRHKAEDQMAGYLNGKGVVSYNYLKESFDKKNEDALREKIKKDGFDGAVTMRLVDVDKEKIYTPGNTSLYPSYYRNFSGYYYRSYSFFSDPGYYSTTKTYTVETNVYSIKEDKIIWSALTKTSDPDGLQKMTEEVTKVVYKKMVKEGFISK
jgi:malate synthase